jgi:tripartite-type tricarboxylate transporter receptor subunit TctC
MVAGDGVDQDRRPLHARQTLNDLIAAARAKPGELAFASGGPGSSLHIAIEVLKRAANLNITYVPYGGTAPAINALKGICAS